MRETEEIAVVREAMELLSERQDVAPERRLAFANASVALGWVLGDDVASMDGLLEEAKRQQGVLSRQIGGN